MSIKRRYTSKDLYAEYGELTFGEVLRSFRRTDEYSQKVFARKLGLSPANLCDLEKERKIPSAARAAKIARKLGLPVAFLIQVALQDTLRSADLDFKVSVAA